MTKLRWGGATDVGLVRRNNQDQFLTTEALFAVADGMGGHAAGEVASGVAIAALQEAFEHDDHHTPDGLIAAMRHANATVFERSMNSSELRGMGTTLTAAALVDAGGEERIAIANVGDSRTYVFAHNELTQLTENHSIPEELVRLGELDPTEVDTHPQRHILTRAVGMQPEIEVDMWEVLPMVGDRIVLCSDGLVREVSDDQIASVLRRLKEPTEAAQELVARARSGGGSDNITVVIVDVVDDDGLAAKASAEVSPTADSHPPPETEIEPEPAPATFPQKPPASPKRRRFTLRVALFVVLFLGVLAGAAGAIVYFARGTYFVIYGPAGTADPSPFATSASRPILIYQGRPGGLLWFDPTLAERTTHISDEVCPIHTDELAHGHIVSSRSAGEKFVANLVAEAQQTCATKP